MCIFNPHHQTQTQGKYQLQVSVYKHYPTSPRKQSLDPNQKEESTKPPPNSETAIKRMGPCTKHCPSP